MIKINEILPIITTTAILFIAATMGAMFTETSWTSMYSIAFAILFYIILPGYCIMLNFNINNLERIIFGMAVSIAVVPVTAYTIDLIGIPLSTRNVLITIILICATSLILRKKFNK